MKVEDKIFYHTAVDDDAIKYIENTKPLEFMNGKPNRRTKTNVHEFKPIANLASQGKQLTWLKYLDYLIEQYNIHGTPPDNWIDLLKSMTYTCYNLNSRYWETLFENIRAEHYPDLPSRLSCLYLADEKNIERWHKKALTDLSLGSLPIYELKVNGEIHYADGEWLEVDVVTEQEYLQHGHKYWKGKFFENNPENIQEILFCGVAEIVHKHPSWDSLDAKLKKTK
ncbi:MAG: DUF2441 domain-containing protein [Bacteroidetes bacterium]|nr:DUF2441 domain-containing protein [Bacteroidota bacterium]